MVGAKGLSGGIEQWSAQVGKPERKAKALGHFGRVSRAGWSGGRSEGFEWWNRAVVGAGRKARAESQSVGSFWAG